MNKIILFISLLLFHLLVSLVYAQSPKRGIAYGHHSVEDMNALKSGISWWYNWSPAPESQLISTYNTLGVQFVPMAWGKINDPDAFIASIPTGTQYLLAFNEPNFNDGARLTPQEAVAAWPALEKIAQAKNLQIVSASPAYNGPDNYGGYQSPTAWHDEFFRLCPTCKVDFIAFHTYDATAASVIGVTNGLKKYLRPVWVTEFANRVIQTSTEKIDFMKTIVESFENDPDIYRYSWFTGRVPDNWLDMQEGQLFGPNSGVLKPIGIAYTTASYTSKKTIIPATIAAKTHYRRKGTGLQNTNDGTTGQNVCFINEGDWTEYLIEVPKEGLYDMKFRLASPSIAAKFDLSVNGVVVKNDETFESTGGWQTYGDKVVSSIPLPKGEVLFKILFKTNDLNFNFFEVKETNTLATDDFTKDKKSMVYPNPFEKEFFFHYKTEQTIPLKIKILDTKGSICYSNDRYFTNQEISLGKELTSGIYFVIVSYETTVEHFKIIKK